MTREELKLQREVKEWLATDHNGFIVQSLMNFIRKQTEPREKRIAELEAQISILLSCKGCPDNHGGYICDKEYNDKCLAQKIQYIKELKEENAELKEKLNFSTQYYQGEKAKDQLIKATKLLNEFMRISKASDEDFEHDYTELIGETEQFLEKVK